MINKIDKDKVLYWKEKEPSSTRIIPDDKNINSTIRNNNDAFLPRKPSFLLSKQIMGS